MHEAQDQELYLDAKGNPSCDEFRKVWEEAKAFLGMYNRKRNITYDQFLNVLQKWANQQAREANEAYKAASDAYKSARAVADQADYDYKSAHERAREIQNDDKKTETEKKDACTARDEKKGVREQAFSDRQAKCDDYEAARIKFEETMKVRMSIYDQVAAAK